MLSVHIFQVLPITLFSQAILCTVFSQAILCTKEVAERARTAAYNLLVEMGKAVIKWSQDPKGKC